MSAYDVLLSRGGDEHANLDFTEKEKEKDTLTLDHIVSLHRALVGSEATPGVIHDSKCTSSTIRRGIAEPDALATVDALARTMDEKYTVIEYMRGGAAQTMLDIIQDVRGRCSFPDFLVG
jgi:hypothetical protein